ncbi:uncharacterized protein LOC143066338 [Mytilus galloprovincialis]|uniref:uncharacterized protein LOC143066338 n=1 Tax=Mytilus galloprovincialis TaxID=29158 RepID=UPI003F7C6351
MAHGRSTVQYKCLNETEDETELSTLLTQNISESHISSSVVSNKVKDKTALLPTEEYSDFESTVICKNHNEISPNSTYETNVQESIDQTCVKTPVLQLITGSDPTNNQLQPERQHNSDNNFNLPPGKKYHLFVSYSSDDTDEVYKICEELEKRFFLKCSNFERDFVAGQTIDDNIKNEMCKSVKVLLVLSSSYLGSLWCMGEAHEAMDMSTRRRNNNVIPIMLRPLDIQLPTILKRYRYIDAVKENDVAAKIRDAFYHSAAVEISFDDTAESNQNGFRLLSKPVIRLSPFFRRGFVYKFSPFNADDLLTLKSQNIHHVQCVQQTKAAIAYVNSRALMKYYRVFIGGMFTLVASTLLAILTFLICIGIGSLVVIIKKSTHGISFLALLLVVGGAVAVWVLTFAIIIGIRQYVTNRVCYFEICDFILNNRCLLLQEEVSNLLEKNKRFMDYAKERLKEITDLIVKEKISYLQEKGFLSKWASIEDADYNRHNTWLCKKCVCQILEEHLINPKVITI